MPRVDPARRGTRAGFTFVEVLAALVVTGAVVAAVLPYAARLASHWWIGEEAVESADGWMQAIGRMGDDLAQATPYGVGEDGVGAAFTAGAEAVTFLRPALGGAPGLDAVTYEVRPLASGAALVRRSRPFDAGSFGRNAGGAPATLLEGPFRLRLVVIGRDGSRRRDWAPGDGMPAAVELSATSGTGRAPVPLAPVLMPVAASAPAARVPDGAGRRG